MDILLFLLCIILGFLLSGIWFGLIFLNTRLLQKLKIKWIFLLNPLFASIIPIVIIAMALGLYPVQVEELKSINVYLVAIFTVIITSAIVSKKKSGIHKKGKELLIYGLDGAFMELPQRLMMQSFVYGLLCLFGVSALDNYTVLATAII